MPVTVKITVPPDLKRALDGDMRKVVQKAAMVIGEELKAELNRKPEAPPYSGRRQWYERRFGPKWHSDPERRWKRTKRAVVYGVNWAGVKTSALLSAGLWELKQTAWGAIVGNPVPYVPLVQSHKEQAEVHKGRWTTDKEAADRVIRSGKVDRAVKAAVAWVMKGKGGVP